MSCSSIDHQPREIRQRAQTSTTQKLPPRTGPCGLSSLVGNFPTNLARPFAFSTLEIPHPCSRLVFSVGFVPTRTGGPLIRPSLRLHHQLDPLSITHITGHCCLSLRVHIQSQLNMDLDHSLDFSILSPVKICYQANPLIRLHLPHIRMF